MTKERGGRSPVQDGHSHGRAAVRRRPRQHPRPAQQLRPDAGSTRPLCGCPAALPALRPRRRGPLPGRPAHAALQTNLASVYRLTGQLEKADPLLRDAVRRWEKLGAAHQAELADTVNALAVLFTEKGQLATAERLFHRCLEIREKKLGSTHLAVADTLNLLAQTYERLGQDGRALSYYRRGLKIRHDKLGDDHLATAASLNDLAVFYLNRDRFAQAEPLLRRAMATFERRLPADHPDVAKTHHNLAWVLFNLGQTDEADRLQTRAFKTWRERENPLLALGLFNEGEMARAAGRLDQAEARQRAALRMREQDLGPDHLNVADSLRRLARVLVSGRRWAEATTVVDRERRLLRGYVTRTLPALTEQQQLAFLNRQHTPELHETLSLARLGHDDDAVVRASAGWLCNGKGLSQEALLRTSLLDRDSRDPEQGERLRQLADLRRQLARLSYMQPKAAELKAHRVRLAELTRQERALAAELRQAGAAAVAAPWVDLDAIRRRLPAGSVLLDIARFRVYRFDARPGETPWAAARYVAWMTPKDGPVRQIDLGPADEIDALVTAARQRIDRIDREIGKGEKAAEEAVRADLGKLAARVLHPLLSAVGEADGLVISPDAELWLVPWAALPLPDGRYAIEKYRITHVVSGRDLVPPVASGVKTGRPIVFAAPDFDLTPAAVRAEAGKLLPRKVRPRPVSRSTTRAALLGDAVPLPGTAREAQAIRPSLAKYADADPRLFTGRQALKSVLQVIRSPRVAVFCTHGFFLPDRPAESGSDDAATAWENPLLRCGVLFAGCNRADRTAVGGDNGILTGVEAAALDLRGCELVVLSACQTGLGAVQTGEGVAGLRMAFQLAGARGVVATLWEVPDDESATLMKGFFTRLADGAGKAEALRQAQLAVIAARRKAGGAAHPYFWAAYTLTGAADAAKAP
ncbi:MAG: CHAT domain-containing tetratricopeptide repeat protein [Gemmataceae bacterium]